MPSTPAPARTVDRAEVPRLRGARVNGGLPVPRRSDDQLGAAVPEGEHEADRCAGPARRRTPRAGWSSCTCGTCTSSPSSRRRRGPGCSRVDAVAKPAERQLGEVGSTRSAAAPKAASVRSTRWRTASGSARGRRAARWSRTLLRAIASASLTSRRRRRRAGPSGSSLPPQPARPSSRARTATSEASRERPASEVSPGVLRRPGTRHG